MRPIECRQQGVKGSQLPPVNHSVKRTAALEWSSEKGFPFPRLPVASCQFPVAVRSSGNFRMHLSQGGVVVVLTHYCDCDHERCLPIIWTLQLLFIVRVVPSGFELGDKPGNWLYNRDRLIASSVPLTIPRWVVPSDPVEFNKTGAEQGGDKLDTPPQNTIHKRRAGYLGRYLLLQLSKDCPRNCTFRIICYSLLQRRDRGRPERIGSDQTKNHYPLSSVGRKSTLDDAQQIREMTTTGARRPRNTRFPG
uniref:HDC13925 n=1 Tax=Drosophila melanogaster TaxID=7227 RepID=Q6IJZ5_DROME|nr:TPA_inf: HDC13925 [Drosophila melanogaster]